MTGPFSVRRARRFARAIDPDRRAPGRPDPTVDTVRDEETRRLVEVTDRLRTGDFNGTPSPEFRARLRAQLVALAETELTTSPSTARHGATRRGAPRPAGRRTSRSTTPRLALLAGTLSALLLCSGLTVVISGHALPGDTLYSLKRTTENVELALAHGPQAKAQRHLDFAQARARELADLVRRRATETAATPRSSAPTRTGDDDQPLVVATLGDMDMQTRTGVRLLTEFAVTTVSDAALADLAAWVADQRAILEPVVERLHGAAGLRVKRSDALLYRIHDRVVALRSQLTCTCMDQSHGDDLGPLPCWPCDPRVAPPPQAGTPPVSTTGGQPRRSTGSASVPSATPPVPSATAGATPSGTSGAAPPEASAPPTDDPSLLPPVVGDPTGGGGLLPPILPTGVLPPLLPGLLPGLLGG